MSGPVRVEHADWLDFAAALAPRSIDLVYADPPFNTGSTQTGQHGAYPDAWPTVGDWVAWLRARVEATLPALKRSACVLVHIDWRTSHHARLMLDELLGADRFVNHLVWAYVPAINNMATERCGYPTQKPLALLEMLVGACCPPGGTVLDPVCGSGTTLVAASRLGRGAIGCDVNPDAVAIARGRLGADGL